MFDELLTNCEVRMFQECAKRVGPQEFGNTNNFFAKFKLDIAENEPSGASSKLNLKTLGGS